MQKNLTILLFGLLSALTISNIACSSATEANQEQQAVMDLRLPEGFGTFYQTFHTDSLYQLDHISWPLSGNMRLDTLSGKKVDDKYQRASWSIHRSLGDDPEFEQRFRILGDGLVEELIKTRVGNYSILRRFALINDEWNLIYYQSSVL